MSGPVVKGMVDLAVEASQSSVLNASNPGALAKVLAEGAEPILSDTDEQLLIGITLAQPAKLHSLVLQAAPGGQAPREVRLFVNSRDISFVDVEELPAVQTLELSDAHARGEPIPLQFVKFQNVSHLTLFISSNMGDEEVSAVSRIQLIGQPIHMTNMSDLKKGG